MKRLFTPVAFLVASALLLCSFGGCADGTQGATDQIRYPTQTHVPTDSPIDNKAIESELNLTHSVAETSYLSFEHSAMVGKTIDNIFGYEVDLVYNRTFYKEDLRAFAHAFIDPSVKSPYDNGTLVYLDAKTGKPISFTIRTDEPFQDRASDGVDANRKLVTDFLRECFPQIELDKFSLTEEDHSSIIQGGRMLFERYVNGFAVAAITARYRGDSVISASLIYDEDMVDPPCYDDGALIAEGIKQLRRRGYDESDLHRFRDVSVTRGDAYFDMSRQKYAFDFTLGFTMVDTDSSSKESEKITVYYADAQNSSDLDFLNGSVSLPDYGISIPGELESIDNTQNDDGNVPEWLYFSFGGKEYKAKYRYITSNYGNPEYIYSFEDPEHTGTVYLSYYKRSKALSSLRFSAYIAEETDEELTESEAYEYTDAFLTQLTEFKDPSVFTHSYYDTTRTEGNKTVKVHCVTYELLHQGILLADIHIKITGDGTLFSFERNQYEHSEKLFELDQTDGLPLSAAFFAIEELAPLLDALNIESELVYRNIDLPTPVYIEQLDAYAILYSVNVTDGYRLNFTVPFYYVYD